MCFPALMTRRKHRETYPSLCPEAVAPRPFGRLKPRLGTAYGGDIQCTQRRISTTMVMLVLSLIAPERLWEPLICEGAGS